MRTDHPWQCGCGSEQCRGQILPTDWKLPELRERYGTSHFVSYIQRLFEQGEERKCSVAAAAAAAALASPVVAFGSPPLVHCGLIRTLPPLPTSSRA
jgi:hypothetical protein